MSKALVLAALACAIMLPTRCSALDVLVNQAGYETNSPKVFRVQRTADYAGDGTFSVRRVSDGVTVFSGTLTRKGSLWNKYYWEGDFGSFRTGGDYNVYATVNGENGTSYNFAIGLDVLRDKTGKLTYQYFTAQRCGAAVSLQYVDRYGNLVTWSHNLCHPDDGYIQPSGPYLDTAGGWHDSGEYQKYAQFFGGHAVFDLLTLYDSDRSYFDAIDADTNGIADILDEAVWQARWLAKMVDGSGHVLKQISKRRSGASWVKPENDTDRIIGTSDDRWVEIGDHNTPTEIIVCASLIRTHRVLASKSLPTENFAAKALAIWDHRVALAVSEGGHNNLGSGAHHVWAGIDLYTVFGQQNCWDRAVQKVDEMANGAISNPASYDEAVEGAGYDLGAMARFAQDYPAVEPQATLARNAVQALMSHHMSMADDPVGLIRRLESGQTIYFPANPSLGLNRLYGTIAWGATEAYKIFGDPAYLRFALDQYNWILGANYFMVCMLEAGGDHYVNKYHTRYDTFVTNGIEPGVVMNGYIRDASGLPWVDFGTGSVSAQANESWLPNSAAYAMALAGMTVFRDSSQIVSNTIPSTLLAGQVLPVTVTVKNTGYIPWTQATEFKLGAVGDSDPFGPGRVDLGPSDSIGNNQQKVFSFNMTAPSTPGTYTTDWRMVQEFVCWFGDTLTKQVQVVPNTPPGPVTGFTATTGDLQVSLSWTNPGDSSFAGTMIRYKTTGYPTSPTDGTLVVDKLAAPASSDSWIHTNLTNGVTHYYRAFSHNSAANYNASSVTASAVPVFQAVWMNQIFDPYTNGNLGGQGNWTTVAAQSQVESSFASGGSGKAILLDPIAAGGTVTNDYGGFTKKTSGVHGITFDAAQTWAGTTSTTIFGSLYFYGDDSATETARFGGTTGQWRLEYGSGNAAILDAAVVQNTWYNIKIVFDVVTRKMSVFVNGASKGSNLSWKTGSGTNIARISPSSSLLPGLTVQRLYLDNIKGETYPAAPASVTDDGAYTGSLNKLHCSWTSGGPSSVEYRYAIGTFPGGTSIVGWTTVGAVTEITRDGLSLENNKTYYFAAQGGNGYGTWSASTNSNGIKTPTAAVGILSAKGLPDGSLAGDNRAIRGKVISAAFPGYFYIQEPGGYYGLKALSSTSVTPGNYVDVAGLMKGAGAERYIDCTGNVVTLTTPGPGVPPSVVMTNASVGGAALGTYAPAVVGAIGPHNIGSAATVYGRVTQRKTTDPKYFYIDDGCGIRDGTTTDGAENVGVRVIADPASYPADCYVAVTGIASCFDSGGLRPQMLPGAGGIQKL
ncbi:MAG: glycoside hydrolase family 9 protein [Armatimonadota bacterium]|nr:glycoside hydrolase family 9 protein [Armatimonadota bacterium]